MNDDQITAIAREYAKECIEPYGFSRETYEELVEEKAESIASAFRWLDRRYCLVEKEALREEYSKATAHIEEAIKNKSPLSESCGKGMTLAILSLFPDLGKEVDYPW